MANQIYRGERLAFAGELKNNGTVTTDFDVICQVFSMGQKVLEVPCAIDTTYSKYYGEIDTTQLLGVVNIRFVARTSNGEIAVSNGFVTLTVEA